MSYRHQELTSPEQTATGKDFSNPLIVDSLLKTIWSSMHHVFTMKHWLVQSKRLLPSYLHPRSYPTRDTPSFNFIHGKTWMEFCDKHNLVAFLEEIYRPAGGSVSIQIIVSKSKVYLLCTLKIADGIRKRPTNGFSGQETFAGLEVKKLESQIKTGKARRKARVVLSDDEVLEDDSSKQGRKLSDAEVQEKASTETELFIQEVTLTEVIQVQEGSEKGSDEVSTAGAKKGTTSKEVPIVSTAEVNLSTAGQTVTYTRRSAEKRSRQDKGKAIMIESEPKKKSKKELEQERLSFAEAIRLEEQMNEEQRAQIARDEEIARQWDEEERQRAMAEAKSTKKIDWNDPSVIRYHTLKMKPKTVAQARKNMIKYLKNQGNYKISDFKGMSYNEIRPIFEKV
ncbi:hypothetical protein Tco_0949335 [Tanacetum coccineum]